MGTVGENGRPDNSSAESREHLTAGAAVQKVFCNWSRCANPDVSPNSQSGRWANPKDIYLRWF